MSEQWALTDDEQRAVQEFMREMTETVIPNIVAYQREQQILWLRAREQPI